MQNKQKHSADKWIDEKASKPFPHEEPVKWVKLTAVTDISKNKSGFCIYFGSPLCSVKLCVVFPKVGGIRICSENRGLYNSDSLQKINYSESDKGIMLSAGGKEHAVFLKRENGWRLKLYCGGSLVNTLSESSIALGLDKENIIKKVMLCGSIGENELFYGLGQRFDSVVRNGTEAMLWNIDADFMLHYEIPKTVDYSYTNIPLLHSLRGYTVFFNTSYAVRADIGKRSKHKYSLESFGNTLDFYYWFGKPDETLDSYLKLTGYNHLPPEWAFSYWAGNSAEYWKYTCGGDYLRSLKEMTDNYSKLGTPVSVMFVEGVISKYKDVYDRLTPDGIKVIGWVDSGYWKKPELENTAESEQPFVRKCCGEINEEIPQKYIDFTNPLSAEFLEETKGEMLKYGLKGAMVDFADAVPYNSVFANGKTGDEMHNPYAYYYQKAYKELFDKHYGNDYILFARAGFAGSQSLMPKFLGDEPCTFYGMRESLTAALNLAFSGFSVWGSDMGGLGNKRKHIPNEDVYRRWLQWSAFNPIMRSHGHTTRGPWHFGKAAVKDFKKYYWLRESLKDFIYSAAIKSSKSAFMMAAPLQIAFSGDDFIKAVDDEYLFCGEILTAPVVFANATARNVLLPHGKWTNFWTGAVLSGNTAVNTRASEGTIPLYIRSGAVIPVKLSRSLKLCENMQNGSVNGIIVTMAEERREICHYTADGTAQRYITDLKDGNTAVISNKDGADVKAVIAKGISAVSVTADGKALSFTENTTACAGYTVDRINRQTVIYLPEKWTELEITGGGREAENLALNRLITSESDATASINRTIADGDASYCWTIAEDTKDFVIDLENSEIIEEIQLTWGYAYACGYTVCVSENGTDFTVVYKNTEGLGDEEVIRLPAPCKARYVRFSDFKHARATSSSLADIRIYGRK